MCYNRKGTKFANSRRAPETFYLTGDLYMGPNSHNPGLKAKVVKLVMGSNIFFPHNNFLLGNGIFTKKNPFY